jgi:hypothetical protein
LYRLDLSGNQLSGNIPSIRLGLPVLDLSYNRFTFDGIELIAQTYPNAQYAPQEIILPVHQNGASLSLMLEEY